MDHVFLDDAFVINSASLCVSVGVLRPLASEVNTVTLGLKF